MLVLYFASSMDECTLKIDGTSKKNAAAIKVLAAALDAAAK